MPRLLPAVLLAIALAPGTFVRSQTPSEPPVDVALEQIAEASAVQEPGWRVEGVWEYSAQHLLFGGFSALLAMNNHHLTAFSDRGARMRFVEPDRPQPKPRAGDRHNRARYVVRQLVDRKYARELWDIESATRDPATGAYWLGFENVHAFHRFTNASAADGVRIIDKEVDWSVNSGAEAMVRLADGRFLVIPESGGQALLYPRDPIAGDAPETLTYISPQKGFGITDVKQMPDGRLLILLRSVVWGIPPFEARIAIADLPGADEPQELAPRFVLDLTRAVPPENYEGLAFRDRGDGTLDVWIISDDNRALMQRTLLAKLVLDPKALCKADKVAPAGSDETHQKARD